MFRESGRQAHTLLNGSGNGKGGDSGIGADRAGCRICDKGCGRHGDTSGDSCKFAGRFIVSIVGIQNKRCAVQRCSQVGQARRESISDNNSGCGIGSGITGVLNLERVGQSSVFSNRNRADRLGDCKNWSGDNTDGFFCGDGSDSSALRSDDICDC